MGIPCGYLLGTLMGKMKGMQKPGPLRVTGWGPLRVTIHGRMICIQKIQDSLLSIFQIGQRRIPIGNPEEDNAGQYLL